MKNLQKQMKMRHLLFLIFKKKIIIPFTILLITCFSHTTNAISNTHEVENQFKGYSVEQVPGADEYIAAGTFYEYDFLNGKIRRIGYHFMHLDANGTVITSVKYENWQWYNYEFRVVDIVPVDQNECWVVMQVRNNTGPQRDEIRCIKLDIATGLQSSTVPNFYNVRVFETNTYPTHSLYFNNSLYICGYTSNHNNDPDSQQDLPTNVSMGKKSFVLKAEMVPGNPWPASIVSMWNTPNGDKYDYDMPLKMVHFFNESTASDDILVVGAANANGAPGVVFERSGVLALHLDENLAVINQNVIDLALSATGYSGNPNVPEEGIYGIDVHYDINSPLGVIVLVNNFEGAGPLRWGILRLDNSLQASTTDPDLKLMRVTHRDWAKQLYVSPNSYREFAVIGERIAVPGTCSNPMIPSSNTNVNPFVTRISLDYTPTGLTMSWVSDITQESWQGTSTPTLDYYTTTPNAAGTNLEDVTRLNTFATLFDEDIITISPMMGTTPNINMLNTKFLRLTFDGDEPNCQNQYTIDCEAPYSRIPFSNFSPQNSGGYTTFEGGDDNRDVALMPIQNQCAPMYGGVFKTAGVQELENRNNINIYPNPASDEINIALPAIATESFSFTLNDVAGKTIYKTTENDLGKSVISIPLRDITPGIYFGTVNFDGNTVTEKIVVQ